MATLAESIVSSIDRPVPLRMRPDLVVKKAAYQGDPCWVVKDPVGLVYCRFNAEEFAVLQMLDGNKSLNDLKAEYERQFAPETVTLDELHNLIGRMHGGGILISSLPGLGMQLQKRQRENRRQERIAAFSNILAIRLKGVDPERLFQRVYPWVKWFFSPWMMAVCLLLAGSALMLVMVHFDVFRAKLPTFHQFFSARNWMALAVTMAVIKVLHEFGHGLSCKHFGGECHELGVLFLVLTPCLYCDTSDSWQLPSKWQRALIGAAGMYVELFLASSATFLWWFSEPGMLHQLCLNTMFVCSVSTVLFNGNPLLRYDGYYILSDLLEIPNLREKATRLLSRKLGSVCLGLEEPDDPFLPTRRQWLFVIYSVAAAVYGWVLMASILWFMYKLFEPYHLEIVGQAFAVAALVSLVVMPLWKLVKFLYVPGRLDEVKRPNLYRTLVVLGLLAAGFFLWPLPYRVYCSFELRPRDAAPVYIEVPGRLAKVFVKPGEKVEPGTPLADLTSTDLQLAIADLTARRDHLQAQMDGLQRERFGDKRASLELPQIIKSLAAVDDQLREKQRDLERLHLFAPTAGIVIPPPSTPKRPPGDDRLPRWSGTPLEARNLGTMLAAGTLFCDLGDPQKMEAILVIDQSDVDLVQEGQPIKLCFDEAASEVFESRIQAIARNELRYTPRQLTQKSGGELLSRQDASGADRPSSTSYQASAPLDSPETVLLPGYRGQAKVEVGSHSLAWRLWRYLQQTFHFRL